MKLSRLVQMLLTVLPVLTAGLYMLGLSYHQGYLAEYGIDDSVFPLAGDKALFAGFFALLTLTFPAALYAIGALGTFVVLVIVAAVLSSATRVQSVVGRIRGWSVRRRLRTIEDPVANDLIDKSAAMYGYTVGFVLVLVLLLVMAVLSAKSGREQARKEMSDFSAGRAATAQVFSSQIPVPYFGKLVMCGDKYCSFWSSAGTVMVRHEAIDRIVTYNPSRKGASTGKRAPAP